MWERLSSNETRVVVYYTCIKTTTKRKAEYTYCSAYLSPHSYSILTSPDWTLLHNKTLWKRGAQQRKKHIIRWNSSFVVLKNTTTEDVWPQQRGKERFHLLPIIVVTSPVFHLDTSWLNTDAELNTAREGATKKMKDQPTNPPTTKVTVSKHKIKITKRVRIVIWWNSSCRILNYTTTEGVATERGR